jgi:hypothetical protein
MSRLDGWSASRHGRLFLGVVALWLWLLPRIGSAAERYVVVESPPFQVRPAEHDQLQSTIQSGLRAAGCEVVDGTARSEKCTNVACWMKLADSVKATDILVVTGGYKDLGWSLSFEHRSADTGVKLGSEKENCDACQFDAMMEKARSTAKHMAESDRAENAASVAVPAEPSPSRALPNLPATPPTEPEANPAITLPEVTTSEGHPIWPVFLIAGGGAVLAGGIVLMAINGRDTDCSQDTCLRRYETMTPGLILGGVGLAAVAVGVWQYVAWQPAGTSVSLRVGPGSFSLMGGF